MELKDFVSITVVQLIDGLNAAIEYGKANNAIVNPSGHLMFAEGAKFGREIKKGDTIHIIDFDLSVVTSEGGSTEGGLGVFIAPITLGAKAKQEDVITTENRISFSIPVILPKHDVG